MNTRPIRVPDIPPRDELWELRQIISPTTSEAKRERRQFIKDETKRKPDEKQ